MSSEIFKELKIYLKALPKTLVSGPMSKLNKLQNFDLALQFDIQRYVVILADSVSDPRKTSDNRLGGTAQIPHTKLKETAANNLAPAADEEWGKW
jgi:hypothetical protein